MQKSLAAGIALAVCTNFVSFDNPIPPSPKPQIIKSDTGISSLPTKARMSLTRRQSLLRFIRPPKRQRNTVEKIKEDLTFDNLVCKLSSEKGINPPVYLGIDWTLDPKLEQISTELNALDDVSHIDDLVSIIRHLDSLNAEWGSGMNYGNLHDAYVDIGNLKQEDPSCIWKFGAVLEFLKRARSALAFILHGEPSLTESTLAMLPKSQRLNLLDLLADLYVKSDLSTFDSLPFPIKLQIVKSSEQHIDLLSPTLSHAPLPENPTDLDLREKMDELRTIFSEETTEFIAMRNLALASIARAQQLILSASKSPLPTRTDLENANE
jgi:hypothetical protein